MVVTLSQEQFAKADAIAADRFHEDLVAEMVVAIPKIDPAHLQGFCAHCRTTCARLGIQTEMAISCFYILSLHSTYLLSESDGYTEQHLRYLQKYGSGDQLPIDLHAWLTACAA